MSASLNSTIKKLRVAISSFNQRELYSLLVSTAALALMFAMKDLFAGGLWFSTFLVYVVTVGLSFFVHEVAQKFVAQKFDCTATYEINFNFLLVGMLLAVLTNGGIVFAAPGAAIISSAYFTRLGYKYVNITNRESGTIALSGPLSNVMLAILSLILYPLSPGFFQPLINTNVFFAIFNMLPIPPLDGNTVFWWNRLVWFVGLSVPVFMFFFAFNAFFALIGAAIIIVLSFSLWQSLYPS